MTTLSQAILSFNSGKVSMPTQTENGMAALTNTADPCTDLFYQIGAMRGKNIIPLFVKAFNDDPRIAMRIALWARDVRQGAGERQIFRDILSWLDTNAQSVTLNPSFLVKVPELGRWDDLLVFKTPSSVRAATKLIGAALKEGNGLCAKWMPRQGKEAVALRNALGMSPKHWRKTLVNLTKVVEQQMCAKDWDNINFSHVPSLAAARYKAAFQRNTSKYGEYVAALVAGDPSVKVNAAAVYPYDVLKGVVGLTSYGNRMTKTELDFIDQQWNALPNYVGDASILPIVDVSGSMHCSVGNNKNLQCIDVAVSLGMYLAEKNTGAFKNTYVTFSGQPELCHLKGDGIVEMARNMSNANWGMNTDFEATLKLLLKVAKYGGVGHKHMPKYLLVLSDMQFDASRDNFNNDAMAVLRDQYAEAGYEMPKIVFWNLRACDNVPVRFDTTGVALVSGFSPTIMKSILSAREFTPRDIMLDTIMNPRYDW